MQNEARKLGIDVLGAVPWGTHSCYFYDSKQDLIDVLVPYFQAGLENNEFCIWITSESLSEKEAEEAMGKAIPDFPRYLASRQAEIIPHTEWYLKGGTFNGKRVLNAWIDKLQQATSKGYDGMRLTGDTAWLESTDWNKFTDYEEEVNHAIGKYRMLAICAYPLHKYGASEIIDVQRNHQCSLIKHKNGLVLIGGSEQKRVEELLQDERHRAQHYLDVAGTMMLALNANGTVSLVNKKGCEVLEYDKKDIIGKDWFDNFLPERMRDDVRVIFRRIMNGDIESFEHVGGHAVLTKSGKEKFVSWHNSVVRDELGKITGTLSSGEDITEQKRAETELKKILRAASRKPFTPLQERFIREGLKDLSESASIRLIFNLCRYRPECDKKVGNCIKHFKSARALLAASDQELQQFGVCSRGLFTVKLLRELPAEVLKRNVMEKSIYKSSREVFDYLYYSMRDLKNEVFKVIYLNSRSQIIDTVDLFEGTVDYISIRPREIIESAISHSAVGLIFVHNHPTGDPTPSKTDKQLTRDLVFVGNILQIKILDHIIIGENSYFSFADDGLIQKYNDNFLDIKIKGVLASMPLYRHYNNLPRGLHLQHQVDTLSNIVGHLIHK